MGGGHSVGVPLLLLPSAPELDMKLCGTEGRLYLFLLPLSLPMPLSLHLDMHPGPAPEWKPVLQLDKSLLMHAPHSTTGCGAVSGGGNTTIQTGETTTGSRPLHPRVTWIQTEQRRYAAEGLLSRVCGGFG